MTRVLLVGGAGWGNVGDDLIADRIVRRHRDAKREVTVAGGPKPMTFLPDIARQIRLDGTAMGRLALVHAISRCSEVIIGGGGLLDDRIPDFYRPFYRIAKFAHALRKPFSIAAVGVGPVQRTGTAEAYRWMFEHAHDASVRDEASQQRVIAAGSDRVPAIVDDPALWEPPSPPGYAPQHDLLVNLRHWEFGARSEERAEKSTSHIVDAVASALNQEFGPESSVGLISMSTLKEDNDAGPLEQLARQLNCRVSRYYDGELQQVEALVASATRVISMRLHLALLGVLHGVQVGGIAYDDKVAQQGRKHGFATVPLDRRFGPDSIAHLLSTVR